MNILSRAILRTRGRFLRLFSSLKTEYWKANQNFKDEGCSLHPTDISVRAGKIASICTGIVALVTLPYLAISKGLTKPFLYSAVVNCLLFSWLMFFAFVWIAYLLWTLSYIIGHKFAMSDMFWGYIEKRWSKRIDAITKEVLRENPDKVLESIKDLDEEEEE